MAELSLSLSLCILFLMSLVFIFLLFFSSGGRLYILYRLVIGPFDFENFDY